jgi:hypothetical protein
MTSTEEEDSNEPAHRPAVATIVCGLHALIVIWVLFSAVVMYSGLVHLPDAYTEAMKRLGVVDHIFEIGLFISNCGVAITLFRLQKISTAFAIAALLCVSGMTVYQAQGIPTGGALVTFLGPAGINILAILYSLKLRRDGVLS